MEHIQYVYILCLIFTIAILHVECQLKFDADGNIVDDGLNLSVPSFPKDQKKLKPLVAKSRPKSERVKGDVAPKEPGIQAAGNPNVAEQTHDANDAKLDELLKAAGLSNKGEKLEAPKADEIKSDNVAEEAPNLNGLDPETLKKIKSLLAEGKKDTKLEQGLQQIPGGGAALQKIAETLGPEKVKKIQEKVLEATKGEAAAANMPADATSAENKPIESTDPNVEPQFKEGEEIQLYPWESEICKDYDEEACGVFKPMCNIMGVIAHKKCRKTCRLCIQDKPKPRTLLATLKEFTLTLTQNGPLAPAFLTVCVDAATAAEKYGLPEKVLSLIIHAYGDVSEDTCENFGPHFNPFGVEHGHPEDTTKHVGDLGILEFRQVPDEWPEGVVKCNAESIGSYGVFDHINLYGENTPCMRPVVLYKGEAPMKEFKPTEYVACNVLQEPGITSYKTGNKQVQVTTQPPASAFLSANRVKGKTYAKGTGDLAAGVQSLSGAKGQKGITGVTEATTMGVTGTEAKEFTKKETDKVIKKGADEEDTKGEEEDVKKGAEEEVKKETKKVSKKGAKKGAKNGTGEKSKVTTDATNAKLATAEPEKDEDAADDEDF